MTQWPTSLERVQIDAIQFNLNVPVANDQVRDSLWENKEFDPAFFPYWLATWQGGLALVSWLVQHQSQLADLKGIEFGCGSGLVAQCVDRNEDWAVDLSFEALSFAQNHGIRNWVCADLRNLPFQKQFDFAYGGEITYEDFLVDAALLAARTCLRKGGFLVLSETVFVGREHVAQRLKDAWEGDIQILEHAYMWNEQKKTARIYRLEKK